MYKCATPKNSDPLPAKKQNTIFSAFGMKQKPQVADIKPVKVMPTKKVNNPKILTDTSEKEPVVRKVTAATIEKWKSELVDFAVNEWLYYEKDASGVPTALFCKFCTDHEEEIKSIDGFTNQYIKGSTNFRKSSVEYHAKNAKSHIVAYELHVKKSGNDSKKLKNFKHSAADSSDVLEVISTMEKNEVAWTKIKFETAYFVAKQELPLTKYKETLKHKKFHGADTGDSYMTDVKAGELIDFIAADLKSTLCKDLATANFFSVICDGSTDSAVIGEEIIYVSYFDPNPPGKDEVAVKIEFLDIQPLTSQLVNGVYKAAVHSIENLNIINDKHRFAEEKCFSETSMCKRIVGFTSDGAWVN